MSRILDTLRRAAEEGKLSLHALDEDFHRDIERCLAWLPCYNGVSIMQYMPTSEPHNTAELDSCLIACGVVFGDECYSSCFQTSF